MKKQLTITLTPWRNDNISRLKISFARYIDDTYDYSWELQEEIAKTLGLRSRESLNDYTQIANDPEIIIKRLKKELQYFGYELVFRREYKTKIKGETLAAFKEYVSKYTRYEKEPIFTEMVEKSKDLIFVNFFNFGGSRIGFNYFAIEPNRTIFKYWLDNN